MKLEEFSFIFKTKFFINLDSYPKGWKRKQIIEAELDNFYADNIEYIQLLIDEDEYDVSIS